MDSCCLLRETSSTNKQLLSVSCWPFPCLLVKCQSLEKPAAASAQSFKTTCSPEDPQPKASHNGSNTHTGFTCLLSFDFPPGPSSQSSHASKLIKQSFEAHNPRDLNVPDGKRFVVRLSPPSLTAKGGASRVMRKYGRPLLVVCHVHGRQDLLQLRYLTTCKEQSSEL